MFLHSSPEKELKIDEYGLFGSFLFFVTGEDAGDAYRMSSDNNVFALEENSVSLIKASSLFYQEGANEENKALWAIVHEVMERFNVDEETAMALLDESESEIVNEYDKESEGEDGWWLQHATARAAKALGFDGVEVTDEQGASYMIDMLGREEELIKLED